MPESILKICFIGYGNMAKAIAKSLADTPNYELRAASPSLQIGIDENGVATHFSNLAILHEADVVILGVKPKQMKEVLLQIQQSIPKHCAIISLAAGTCLTWLANYLPHNQPLVRAMPNLATEVKAGATVLIANQFLTQRQKDTITQVFERSGIVAWLEHEKEINLFTALSGSGPAYFFLFLEEMVNAGEKLGLTKELAKNFTYQTMVGAATLAGKNQLNYSALRKRVASPKGTTEAAIHIFQTQKLDQIIFNAMEAAYLRAEELEKENSKA